MGNPVAAAHRNDSQCVVRDCLLIRLTMILGWVSLALTLVFFFYGALSPVKLELGTAGGLLWNGLLSMLFFVQHSGMIRESFQQFTARFIDEKYHGAMFTIASSITLILLVVLWQGSDYVLASAEGGVRWFLRGVFVCSFVGFYWGARTLGGFDMFGIKRIRRSMRGVEERPPKFNVRGPYRWVRHPLYLFCLLMIWSCPDLTADRLLFDLLWTGWIVVGSILEERDLVKLFGADYQLYREQVPMLIPHSFRPAVDGKAARNRPGA
ncbi:methyltransferase family protein [Thermodesulfobacteriota bacterium]